MLSKEELKNLNSKLPTKPGKIIHERCIAKGIKCSHQTVINNLNGTQFRAEIIEAAMEIMTEHMEKVKKLKEQLS